MSLMVAVLTCVLSVGGTSVVAQERFGDFGIERRTDPLTDEDETFLFTPELEGTISRTAPAREATRVGVPSSYPHTERPTPSLEGWITWTPFSASDLTSRPHPRYLADMSIYTPESVRSVKQALIEAPAEGMSGKQVWEAIEGAVPEHTVHLILQDLAREGLVARETTARKGRRAVNVFRAVEEPSG